MSDKWEERKRPERLERRYEFEQYADLRDFLDKAADISEKHDYYPNMGFGKDYVNITIYVDEKEEIITDNQRDFSKALDEEYSLTEK